MLCQFTFKNYKSFRDEATLDMQAAPISEQEESLLLDDDGQKFLPLAAIYGPNGSGKSTVLEAFIYLISIVMRPIYILKTEKEIANKKASQAIQFKFDDNSMEEPSEFEVFFRTPNAEYRYNLKIRKNIIVYESLHKQNINGKRVSKIFIRDISVGKIEVGPQLKSIEKTDVAESMPFLAYIKIMKNIDIINEVIDWFDNCELINYANPFRESEVVLFKDEKIQKIMFKMLKEMDSDIVNFRYERDDKGDDHQVFTKHIIGKKEYELKLEEESSGTIKLFSLLPFIIRTLAYGGIIVIDEMDAKLHPKLIRYIIELFSNRQFNPFKAQFIFTSHDLSTMKKEIFRRDEIWFVAKDATQSSRLYSLVEFKDKDGNSIRKDATFDKQYLEGRYGADPYLRCCLNWEADL